MPPCVPQRRARPALGTLVEVGALPSGATEAGSKAMAAVELAFAAIADVEAALSCFMPDSDLSRFHRLVAGGALQVHHHTAQVLAAAATLYEATEGLFDISLGTGPQGWALATDGPPQAARHRLTRLHAGTCLDAGGLAKGYAVDAAIQALQAAGCHAGWVNAGGDLRCFGDLALPLVLRDEASGGTRAFAELRDGAFATSHYGPGSRSTLHCPAHRATGTAATPQPALAPTRHHVSVAAPLCLWADALTKVVAASGDPAHPLLTRYGAQAWCHTAG